MKKLVFAAAASAVAFVFAAVGCGNDSIKDQFVATFDAGSDAGDAALEASDEAGIDTTLGGPCNDDAQCDDSIDCTADTCDKTLSRCRNTPDDTKCDDGKFCNGAEVCVARQGCATGAVNTCEDSDGCTVDTCVETTKSCTHVIRDVDGDGDGDNHCNGGHDCDDTNPNVNSKHAEVCGNLIDDNCNGEVDEQPCTVPANDTCAAAQTVNASSTLLLSTVATKQDYATSCATSTTGAQDIVVAVQVPAGPAQDILLRAKAAVANVAITLESTCGSSASELQCINLQQPDTRAIAHSVAGGSTIYVILTTSNESAVTLDVNFQAATPPPTNEDCTSPQAIALNTAIPVSLVGAKRDIDSTCVAAVGDGLTGIGDLTYSFTLTQTQDVKIFASTTLGTGNPIVSLRGANCVTDETTCHEGNGLPLFRRSLAPGTYVLAVSGDGQIDENLVVQTSTATTAPADESCSTAPALDMSTATVTVDLTNHESLVDPGCHVLTGDPTAVRLLSLPQDSDVIVIGRFAQNDTGLVALTNGTCTIPSADTSFCANGASPQRVSKHGLVADQYQIVMADSLALPTTLTTLVRPTIAATPVTADACADIATIPDTGGYFSGDTSQHNADFKAGCDDIGQPVGGAKDQLMKLTLTEPKRVVFDMTGSQYTALLDVRTGEPCPGIEVMNGCARPGNSQYPFLDMTLDKGTYYIQIDGVSGAAGKWTLDVRVTDPPPQ